MHNASTIRVSDKGGTLHSETAIFLAISEEIEKWDILCANEVASFDLFEDFELVFSEEVFESTFCEDEYFISLGILHLYVDEIGIDCECEV